MRTAPLLWLGFVITTPVAGGELLFRNATVLTVTRGTLHNASILVREGRIVRVGADVTAGPGAAVIDATGKWITPGLVDCHNHIAADSTNEAAVAVSSMTGIEDVIDPTDINIYRDLAGGVSTAHVLHGSANPIGGKNVVLKLRWGKSAREMLVSDAKPSLKFALGENPKRPLWTPARGEQRRYPASRMGVEDVIRSAFTEARNYQSEWDEYERKRAAGVGPLLPPRRDLRLEPLVEVLKGQRMAHVHAYRADEMLMMIRLADEFGFKISTFDHGLEGYKIAAEIARHGAGVTTFSDWWAYKFEAYDAIPFNAAILTRKGVLVSINSDGPEESRHLNQEAAKCMKYGGLSEDEAMAMVTINPARQLGVEHRVGSIEPGKDADLVVYNRNPLSVYSVPEEVYIDGQLYFSREQDRTRQEQVEKEKQRLLEEEKEASKKPEEDRKERREGKPVSQEGPKPDSPAPRLELTERSGRYDADPAPILRLSSSGPGRKEVNHEN
jgi:imidazolonepropionase-like amidohydrolase